MVKKILPAKDPILRKKSKRVKKIDKKVLRLVKDLKETLVAQKDPEGVGLAAPQIGKNLRVFVIKPKDKVKVFINPKLVSVLKKKSTEKKKPKTMEGCLSVPNYYGPLRRAQKIKVEYQNTKGETRVENFEGLSAQIILHEIDHLNGKLFIDHLLKQKQKLYEYVDGDWEEVDLII
jgi:peptide deformylase